ncbi:membrane-associated proteins in eicosanoid and glutathione metabolism [Tilletiopsis washingtonensis]|uniref:Membrane-associated proteins in eicosanoid and glutathione metabolism n=1 Tax=Tilletiopsis washingtonensis TaxID=58919 RepID=A0A316Z4W4_9BASI|nr:membrane-associated proteins in eicosanoid and glutathione metabolism [Tilletiopsis washingtonensis]PWN96591.1 membrane-associated proteins in eicosanoid and glutathione metabolism [Tilletiopsis washingtonensis]
MVSAIVFSLPPAYPAVLGVAVSTVFLNIWQNFLVGSARRASGIKYPQIYAEQAELAAEAEAVSAPEKRVKYIFNCTQRAHQNTLESLPGFLTVLAVASTRHARVAAWLGGLFVVGRAVYTVGYIQGDPRKRMPGSILSLIPMLGLLGTATTAVYQLANTHGLGLF